MLKIVVPFADRAEKFDAIFESHINKFNQSVIEVETFGSLPSRVDNSRC